ncbi:MAG: DUF3553 domain-containing protein [Vicinamibacterales bacterium]
MFKPGDPVRHRNKPEWGLGRVSGETGDGKVLVKFAARKGDVLLAADFAEKFLVPDEGVIAAPIGARSTTPPVVAAPPPPKPIVRTPCVNCAIDLQAIVISPDGAWRSCPSCSARGGRNHVFLPFPSSFDVVQDPVPDGETSDDPQYGWCNACRRGGRAGGFKTCFQVR